VVPRRELKKEGWTAEEPHIISGGLYSLQNATTEREGAINNLAIE
jgi:hypothetical protein